MLEDNEMRYQIFQGRPRILDEALPRALKIEASRLMEVVGGECPRAARSSVESEDHDRSRLDSWLTPDLTCLAESSSQHPEGPRTAGGCHVFSAAVNRDISDGTVEPLCLLRSAPGLPARRRGFDALVMQSRGRGVTRSHIINCR